MMMTWFSRQLVIRPCCLRALGILQGHVSHIPLLHRLCSSSRKIKRQEQIEDTIFQYATKNTKRADRTYVWGYAATGALGVKKFLKPEKKGPKPRTKQLTPHRLNFFDAMNIKVRHAACGYGFSVLLCETENGHMAYGAGINTDSQLGFQEFPRRSGRVLDYVVEPAPMELPLEHSGTTKLVDASCGRAHTMIVTDGEGVFSLGNNSYGQCGRPIVPNEDYKGNQIISKVKVDGDVKEVICGQDHSLLLTTDGRVFSCGLGSDGQTGLGHYDVSAEPREVVGDTVGETITSVSSRGDCVLAVSDKGDVFGWGNSEYDQLSVVSADVTQINVSRHLPFKDVGKVVKVAAVGSMCALLNDQGQVYVWGYGILGLGPNVSQTSTPQLLPEPLFGKNEFNPAQRVTDIHCGISHFAAQTETGDLYVWGRNKMACLGLGHVLDQFFPFKVHVPAEVRRIACGVDHMIVLCKAFA